MKKIGLIGGLGPFATLDYYKGIINSFIAAGSAHDYPEIFIHSLNLGQALPLFQQGRWDQVAQMLLASLGALERAGAQFAAIASNTPHLVFDRVQAASPLPLVSILEATRERVLELGLKRPALLGTKTTMSSRLYQDALAPSGVEVLTPLPAEQERIQYLLDTEIELGVIKHTTHRELVEVVDRMKHEQGVDAAILGCTELPLILDRDELGLPFLNTTAIHVAAIVDYCRG